jgi:Tfp pilus assembly protein PilZ
MSETPRAVEIRFRSKEEFLKLFLEDVQEGGVLWPSDDAVSLNEILLLRIRFAGIPDAWELYCRVIWRHARPPGRDDLPEGVGLVVEDQSLKDLKLLLRFCKEKNEQLETLYRSDERTEVRYDVPYLAEYLVQRRLNRVTLSNISETGCFMLTDNPLPISTHFIFFMYRPNRPRPWVLEGEVRWVQREGGKKGMGVKLLFDLKRHKLEVKRLISNVESGADQNVNELDETAYSTGFLASSQLPEDIENNSGS